MFGFIKTIFIILISVFSAFSQTKCVSLSNQKCEIQPTLLNLHPNENNQELHYYQLAIKLDICVGTCNTLNDLYDKQCVSNETWDLNLSVFIDMITWTN